jgi:hypothetical protein
MNNPVAVFIVNFNMVERCDALVESIQARVKWPHDICVIDNGSDLTEPSQYTMIYLPENVQTTGGWLAGLESIGHIDYLAYWFLITSAEFPPGDDDMLAPMAELFLKWNGAVGVHPALTADSTTSWEHMKERGGNEPRRTWMIDNIASLYRADWFDRNGRFDPALRYAWGIDLEMSLKARRQGHSLWIHEGSRVKKVTNIGYSMNRMSMSAGRREQLAGDNMREVLSSRYGPYWWQIMNGAHVEPAWR